jgi:hypothetical protein
MDDENNNGDEDSKAKKVDMRDLIYPGTFEERWRYILLRFLPPGKSISPYWRSQ